MAVLKGSSPYSPSGCSPVSRWLRAASWSIGAGCGPRIGADGRLVNATGALATAAATVIFLATKFTEGAWVVVVAVPAFIFLFLRVHAYYQRAAQALEIGQNPDQTGAQADHRRGAGVRGFPLGRTGHLGGAEH